MILAIPRETERLLSSTLPTITFDHAKNRQAASQSPLWVRCLMRHPTVVATRVRECRGLSVPYRRGDCLSWCSADTVVVL